MDLSQEANLTGQCGRRKSLRRGTDNLYPLPCRVARDNQQSGVLRRKTTRHRWMTADDTVITTLMTDRTKRKLTKRFDNTDIIVSGLPLRSRFCYSLIYGVKSSH
ncbi:hypothetical protein N7510_001515 [Penicillium lagena]|uniref:uncharacterized protein n=1 Tax=Penicillium lagena TaxID=94218 RepID=UPI00253FB78F|nr:uncharacterized protein N7510_001515 [Penicillium lagena]KAJ5625206.1 hypothetical protein N7510_001515 [Penicillium lagena]